MMKKNFAFVIGAALVLLAGSFASAATFNKETVADGTFTGVSGDVLYEQLDDPSGSAFVDQIFEAAYAAYDSEGADDFEVTDSGWEIEVINTPGSQTVAGTNPFFMNHAFYADAGGLPGAVLDDCDFPANTDFFSEGDGDTSTNVDCFAGPGVTWMSQSARQDFNPFGQFFWATRSGALGTPAVFRNPGNGFATGCLDWSPANAVCGQTGQDNMFQLLGSVTIVNGTPAVGPFGVAVLILALGSGSAYVLRRRRA